MVKVMSRHFLLTNDPWVTVVRRGEVEAVSLRTLLREAHDIRDLDWSSPLEAAALMGLLVTIVGDIGEVSMLETRLSVWRQGSFDTGLVDRYLDEHAGAFDLFSESQPFYQTAGLEALSGEPKPISVLRLEAATGNNVPLFSTSTEASGPSLTPAEAARRLLVCLAFDTAAIKTGAQGDPQAKAGKTTGNPTGPLGQLGLTYLIGRNLFETLVLNQPVVMSNGTDLPAWRREPPSPAWSVRPTTGPLDLGSWQSRRVRLVTDVDADGEVRVTKALVCAGDRLAATPIEMEWRTGWRRVERPKPGDPPLRPLRHQAGRAAWRGLPALISESTTSDEVTPPQVLQAIADPQFAEIVPRNYPLAVQLVGVVYGNQSAVVEHVIADRTPVPVAALRESADGDVRQFLVTMAHQADAVSRALNNLNNNLRQAVGGERVPWGKGQMLGESFLLGLNAIAHRVLLELSEQPEDITAAAELWEQHLWRDAVTAAHRSLNSVAAQAFVGRAPRGPTGDRESGALVIRQQNAEAFFWNSLRKALPLAASAVHEPTRSTYEGESDD
jgi:CRISPR system Cascade subunit CasA